MNKWHVRFIEMAKLTSTWSKDPRTQVGALIVGENKQNIIPGYNGFPRHIEDNERLFDSKLKNAYMVHAEANAIYNCLYSGIATKGATLYVYGLSPCMECAKTIIQSGIKTIVSPKIDENSKWFDSMNNAKSLFEEANVNVIYYTKTEEENVYIFS